MTNWETIRREYITASTTYRELAGKYGVSLAAVTRRAGKEGWVDQRRQWLREGAGEQARQGTAGPRPGEARQERLLYAADQLLEKTVGLLEGPEALDDGNLRSISTVLKAVKDIQAGCPAAQEQSVSVALEGEVMDYAG